MTSTANPNNHNWYSGWYKDSSPFVEDVYSALTDYIPYVANVTPPGGGYSMSTAWVMLASSSSPQWAQVGWAQHPAGHPGGSHRTFYQTRQWVSDHYQLLTDLDGPVPPDYPYREYEVRLYNSNFQFWAGGQNQTQWQQRAYFLPGQAATAAELTTAKNQMAGGYNNPMWFLNTIYKSNNVTYPMYGYYSNDAPNWFGWELGDLSGYILKVWDKACSQ